MPASLAVLRGAGAPEVYWPAFLRALGVELEPTSAPLRARAVVTPKKPLRRKKYTKAAKPRVVSRRRRHTRPAAAAPTTPPPAPSAPAKVLTADERLELLKVRASAPRPRPRKPKAVSPALVEPELTPVVEAPVPVSVKPPAPTPPAGREREQLGVGICNDCRRREPLFRHRSSGLCRNCHPYGGQLEAA